MGIPKTIVLCVNKAAPNQHDCGDDGRIKMTELNGIKTFTARELILPENALKIPSDNLDTQLLMRDEERDKVLTGRHTYIQYDVPPEFWQHPLFDRIEQKPDEHPKVRRALPFSQQVYKNLYNQEKDRPIAWLFPDVASIKHSCDPNCRFENLQDEAENGICRLTVLKPMNPGDEITIDWYDTSDQRTKRMTELGDYCTTDKSKDCIKCGRQAQKRAKC